MALIQLLADPLIWRGDLFDDDEPRLVCECTFEIHRPDGIIKLNAPILELADTLRFCFERALNTRTAATEYLWDTGERVSVSMCGQTDLSIELPVGTSPIVIEIGELVGFIADCYSRGMSAFTQSPAIGANVR